MACWQCQHAPPRAPSTPPPATCAPQLPTARPFSKTLRVFKPTCKQILDLIISPPPRPGLVSASDAAQALDLTPTQMESLYEALSALSVSPGDALPGKEPILVHELSLFLFALLFSKEAQRPDSMEYWANVESPMPVSFGPAAGGMELLSPTRQVIRTGSQGACATLRVWRGGGGLRARVHTCVRVLMRVCVCGVCVCVCVCVHLCTGKICNFLWYVRIMFCFG